MKKKAGVVMKKFIGAMVLMFLLPPFAGYAYEADRGFSSVDVYPAGMESENAGIEKVTVHVSVLNSIGQAADDTVYFAFEPTAVRNIWVKEGNVWKKLSEYEKNSMADDIYVYNDWEMHARIDGELILGVEKVTDRDFFMAAGLEDQLSVWSYLDGRMDADSALILDTRRLDEEQDFVDERFYELRVENPERIEVGKYNSFNLAVYNRDGEKNTDWQGIYDADLLIREKAAYGEYSAEIKISPDAENSLLQGEDAEFSVEFTENRPVNIEIFLEIENDDSFADNFVLRKEISFLEDIEGVREAVFYIGIGHAYADGQKIDLPAAPYIEEGRTLVPVRAVSEVLGAEVDWDASAQSITVTRGGRTVIMTIASHSIVVSGEGIIISDVAPRITGDGYTMLPFRVIAEILGAQVEAVFNDDGSVLAVRFYNVA